MRGKFLSHLDTRAYRDGEFVLLNPFGFEFQFEGCGPFQLFVPEGFITDFASIPWLVQALPGFKVNGASRFAAGVHDWLYCNNGVVGVHCLSATGVPSARTYRVGFSRAEADEIFRQALLATGYDQFTYECEPFTQLQARLYWAGVRSAGWYYWRKRSSGIRKVYDFAEITEVLL